MAEIAGFLPKWQAPANLVPNDLPIWQKNFGMIFAYANPVPQIKYFYGMIFAHSKKLFPNTILT